MHLVISSNAILSRRRVWLKKQDFGIIQQEIEKFKLKEFPELGNRKVFEKERHGIKRSVRESAARLRSREPSHKEQLATMLATILRNAHSRDELESNLAQHDLSLYQRRRSAGVQTAGGRKYRMSTLGLGENYTEAVTRFDLAESRMAMVKKGRGRDEPELERGC